MSSLKLQFCKRNLQLYSQSVYDYLKEKYPNEKIDIVDCAGEEVCPLCADVPFAIRNNALVGGRTARDLLYKLERGMEFLEQLPEPKQPDEPVKAAADSGKTPAESAKAPASVPAKEAVQPSAE